MKNYLQKTQNSIKSLTQEQIIVGLTVTALVLIGLIYFASRGEDEPELEVGSIEQPLQYENNKQIELDEATIENINKDEEITSLPIYDFKKVNHSSLVQNFMVEIGDGFVARKNFDDIVYYWTPDADYPEYVTEYNAIFDRVFFRFVEPRAVDKVTVSVSSNDLGAFFSQFVNTYFSKDLEYGQFKISSVGRGFRIEANRMIDGVPLQVQAAESYSDYLVIDSDGRIIEGSFYLFDYDEKSSVEVDLVDIATLGAVISRNDYPLMFQQGDPVGLNYEELGVEAYEYDPESGFQGDAYDLDEEIPQAESCTATRIEIVYLFVNINAEKLAPVYRIDCRGKVTIKEKQYDVPIIIYASAIDPQYVYVPGNIEN